MSPLQFHNDQEAPQRKYLFRSRLVVAYLIVIIVFTLLIMRMAQLQWIDYEQYHGLAEGNRISVETLPPTRGKIFDRNQVLLADNQPVYTLSLVRENIPDLEALKNELLILLDNIDAERITSFFTRFQQKNRSKHYTLPFSLSEKQASQFAVISHRFPGVTLSARLKRVYPFGDSAVHALGYVGRINNKEKIQLDASRYKGTEIIGKLGIERFYEDTLHGKPGLQKIERNARGRVLRRLKALPATPGQDIQLTLNIKLQQYAENLMQGRRGSIVAMVPQTGEVLAFVSFPTFDPNLFVDGIDQKNYSRLLKDPDRPFINRAMNGQYPPGSTIKPFVALGGLENDHITPQKKIYDPGYIELAGRRYRDWKRGGHGLVDVHTAIEESCDTYFYELGLDMGIDNIHDALEPFSFGKKTGIDLPGESVGILPSQAWKKAKKGLPWYRGETINSSIGQGYNLSTPLQLATATAILANRGKIITPHLLSNKKKTPSPNSQIQINNISNWDAVIDSMVDVLHGDKGTARRHGRNLSFKMAGKTGTSQVFSLNEGTYNADELDKRLHDHSLFMGFAPVEKPKIAVAVVVENAGSGSRTAAPMAVKVAQFYLQGNKAKEANPK